ncbi:MAG: phosphate signaling complex protein PhoU [Zetaproteobacteria bacterium]|nr:phosphate signaling complex protein PhoU [Zetaproteobacteria bacterium]
MAKKTQHIMKRFDKELEEVKEIVLSMGELVEQSIKDAMETLISPSEDLAHKILNCDKKIEELEAECEELAQSIIVRRQPTASDLRFIIAIIKLLKDLEYMGHLSASISSMALQTVKQPTEYYDSLESMGEKVVIQVHDAFKALANSNSKLAHKVIDRDQKINKRYRVIQREVLTYMLEEPHSISHLLNLSNVAKQLERIADHAVHVSKLVISYSE